MNFVKPCLVFLALTLSACSEGPCDGDRCEPVVSVAHSIDFALAEDGVTQGFDLDDTVSIKNGVNGCGHADYANEAGVGGIDNNAAILFDAVNSATEASVEEIIRDAINGGRLLLTYQLSGLDSAVNDDCVDVEIFQSVGTPLIGTDSRLLPGQTFDIDQNLPSIRIECATVKGGVLEAGPFTGKILITILRVEVNLTLNDARLIAKLVDTPNGVQMESQILGAGLLKSELHEMIIETNDGTIQQLGPILVDSLTDLAPDKTGECQQLSATMLIKTTNAFLY